MSETRGSLFVYLRCRLLGHKWGWAYRDDGSPLNACERCSLQEEWAGGALITSTNWRESERLNRSVGRGFGA